MSVNAETHPAPWRPGFRWREEDGIDRCWMEAVAQVLSRPGVGQCLILVHFSALILNLILVIAMTWFL